MKKITFLLVLLMTISYWQAQSQTYIQENFNTSIPATWTITDEGEATGDSWISGLYGFGGNSLDGTNGALVDSDSNGNGTLMIETLTSPIFDASTATALFLDFDQFYQNAGSDFANVEVFDGTNWVEVLNQTASIGSFANPDQQHIDITAYANAAMQVRFVYNDGDLWAWYWMIDNVLIYNATCPNPTGLAVDLVTSNSVELSWAAGGTEGAWEVVIQPAGTGLPTGSGDPTSINTGYTDSTLSPATDYEAYVRADCSGDQSIWTGPITFTTDCAIFTPIYSEDFTTIPANCWEVADNGDVTTGPLEIGTSTWLSDGFLNNGFSGAYKINLWQATRSDWLLSPTFDLTGGPFQVEFDFGIMTFSSSTNVGTLGSDDVVELLITTDNGSTWTVLQTLDSSTVVPVTGTHIVQDLTAYSGTTARFGIRASEGTVDDINDNDVFVDNFLVRPIPACPDPLSLIATVTGDTSADISWSAGGSESEWQIWVQPAGTGEPTTDGEVTSNNNPYQATGLTPSTAYEVYVRANCNTDGFSVWIGPVNFTTFNTPPPAPVGVTCSSGGSTFVFTETFGSNPGVAPAGWTGTGFGGDNGDWRITNPNDNSFGTGPNISWDGNTGVHLEYEASGDATDIASAITPSIDLSPAVDGVELSFYMHAFGANMGTLNVGVSTSATGPFTTEYTWVGDYQSTADEAWVPIGINLDAYLGEVIYIEFSYEGAGTGFEGDLSIDQIQVETCGTFCVMPNNITVDNLMATSADISWTPSGTETQWNYVLQPAGTGIPTSGTTVGTTTVSETGLTPETDYEVYVQAICSTDNSVWAGPVVFTTPMQTNFVLDCINGGPQTLTYCYENNDTNIFTFTSADGTTPLNITFNAGQVEQGWDELVVFDSDGTTDLNAATPYGNNGDVSGLQYQSTGSSIAFQVQADGVFDCGSQGYTSITVTVNCATCVFQTVDFTTITDCSNGNSQFFVDVNVTDTGDSNSLTITDNQGNDPIVVSDTGITQVGPYPLGTDVVITVANTDDGNCVVTSSTLNVPICPPANDECSGAIVVTPNPDENCTSITSASLFGATASSQANTCSGTANDDVWFQFTASATDHGIDISNIVGDTTNLNHGLYEGTDCNNLTNLYCETGNSSIANGLTVGTTYFIRIYTDGDTIFQDVSFDLCVFTIPPSIITNDTQYTVPELVTDVLVNSPCAIVNNITWSSGADFGTDNGIGYFDNNGSSFPFESGIVLTTGNVNDVPGPETGTQSGGGFGWPGDADLEAVINEGTTNNASVLEFDFTPLIDQMSFNFIFASEEYGTFQCSFSDAFVFLLTDLTTGVTTNLAVVPGTTTPVSVLTIRDEQYNPNGGCGSSNPTLFDFYSDIFDYTNGIGSNPITSPIDFRGRTVPLTASSPVTPNNPYHIKLVVADDGDTAWDSAVFLEASSFDIGTIDLGNDILISNGTASCEGDDVVLDLGIAPPTNATITWYTVANGITEPILGENGTSLTVSEEGVYQVDITFPGVSTACFYSDDIVVEFFPNPEVEVGDIPTITACDSDDSGITTFDLTENENDILGTQTDTSIVYYETEQDAIDETNPITNPTSYTSSPTTIYIRLTNDITSCYRVESFDIDLAPKPVLGAPDDLLGCDNNDDGIAEYNLTLNESLLANSQTGLTFSYYLDATDAATSTNALSDVTNYQSSATTIYVRAENTDGCFEVTTFDLFFGIQPETSFDSDIIYEVCPNATVPITVTATPDNYSISEVSIVWYDQDDNIIPGATSLDLDTVLTEGEYTIEVTFNDTGCSNTATVDVFELESCIIPQGISPNNDGVNDNFDLSSFDVQRLEIYNRYGTLVYSKDSYSNEWHGQSNDGEELPVGTYYFVMKYQGTKQKAAWVYINR